ncbi:hypothetical protein E2C01_006077 [Portunus trituberculatus]|uniref:Uncharacterized protein n=1 Tax=Portunus trituberculatus TaxID=210409 RepID=A0A5B7CW48_PORTR|nr:hypothetical protein [Portunus trituberculatus]
MLAQAFYARQGKALSPRFKTSTSTHIRATFSYTYPHTSTSIPPAPPSPTTSATGRFPRAHYQMSTSSSPPPYFCLVHGYGRHSSEHCRQIAQIRSETDGRRIAGPQPTGEAALPVTKNLC